MNWRMFGTVLNAGAFIGLVLAATSNRLDRNTAHWLLNGWYLVMLLGLAFYLGGEKKGK